MGLVTELKDGLKGLWSLVVGLGVTGKAVFRPQITVHYPRRKVDNLATFRGHIELVGKDDNPSEPRCIACMLCAAICPSQCIKVVPAKQKVEVEPDEKGMKPAQVEDGVPVPKPAKPAAPAKGKSKAPGLFFMDYNLCSLCGLCVQNCPVDSLAFSKDVYSAGFSRSDYEYDLLARMRARAEAGDGTKIDYRPGKGLDLHLPRVSTDEVRAGEPPSSPPLKPAPKPDQPKDAD